MILELFAPTRVYANLWSNLPSICVFFCQIWQKKWEMYYLSLLSLWFYRYSYIGINCIFKSIFLRIEIKWYYYTYIYKFMGFITVPSCKKTDMDFCEKKVSVVRMNRIVSKILNFKKKKKKWHTQSFSTYISILISGQNSIKTWTEP